MATSTIIDYRRYDYMRTLWTPYWMVSSEISAVDSDDLFALCFQFPAADYGTRSILIEKIAFQVTEAFAGGTITVNVGAATIATTDDGEDGDTATDVDQDEYIPTADITSGSTGTYFAATGDWITQRLLQTNGAPCLVTPADSTVPCVGVWVASDATITAGKGRIIMQVTEVPTL